MHKGIVLVTLTAAAAAAIGIAACAEADAVSQPASSRESALHGKRWDEIVEDNSKRLFRNGKRIFRHDTFGSEAFWGDTLQLHKAILGAAQGGVGPGVSPKTALEVGLKVDAEALPESIEDDLRDGEVNLEDPAVTALLIRLDAVVGVKGTFNSAGTMTSMGITCALCHSTVNDSFAPGIGRRLDGWPNRDLNVGVIISLAPNLEPLQDLLGVDRATLTQVLQSWGPGRYDAELNMDGKVFRPDGKPGTTVLPAAFGLAGQNLHTYTGWGSVPYWNAFVAVTQMRGQGRFYDPRLGDTTKFPLAQRTLSQPNVNPKVDLVTAKLPALHHYQISLPAPKPPSGSFDAAAAERGEAIFSGKARCATCHVPPLYSEPGWAMHTGAEIGIDDFQAERSPDGRYRTTPLAGLFTREKGGFYHDGRFADYAAVVDHYNAHFNLGLSSSERADLIEFLKSL